MRKKIILFYIIFLARLKKIKIIEAKNKIQKRDVFKIRWTVFHNKISTQKKDIKDKEESDEYDENALHLLAKKENRPIGTVRLIRYSPEKEFRLSSSFPEFKSLFHIIDPFSIYEISRLTVLKDYRGDHVASFLLIREATRIAQKFEIKYFIAMLNEKVYASFSKFSSSLEVLGSSRKSPMGIDVVPILISVDKLASDFALHPHKHSNDIWSKYFRVYDILNELYIYRDLVALVMERLDVKPNEKILDVGSGTGNFSVQIQKKGGAVVSIDDSEEGLLRHFIKMPTANLLKINITRPLPFLTEEFDKIICINTLYLIPKNERLATINELRRVLKKGGIIILVNPHQKTSLRKFILEEIKSQSRNLGILKAFIRLLKNSPQIFMLTYYNVFLFRRHIKNREQTFLTQEEQQHLLIAGGFSNQEVKKVYADQNIMNVAIK